MCDLTIGAFVATAYPGLHDQGLEVIASPITHLQPCDGTSVGKECKEWSDSDIPLLQYFCIQPVATPDSTFRPLIQIPIISSPDSC